MAARFPATPSGREESSDLPQLFRSALTLSSPYRLTPLLQIKTVACGRDHLSSSRQQQQSPWEAQCSPCRLHRWPCGRRCPRLEPSPGSTLRGRRASCCPPGYRWQLALADQECLTQVQGTPRSDLPTPPPPPRLAALAHPPVCRRRPPAGMTTTAAPWWRWRAMTTAWSPPAPACPPATASSRATSPRSCSCA